MVQHLAGILPQRCPFSVTDSPTPFNRILPFYKHWPPQLTVTALSYNQTLYVRFELMSDVSLNSDISVKIQIFPRS